ncbi:MAG: hypothetical protein BZ133_04555 [Methanosphaera sp. SHI613]|jgi:AraC-like DNA-binding protein|nr:MAG: hypothetical protein BZ133_04555 [Methanosphaera sp. SHI613]
MKENENKRSTKIQDKYSSYKESFYDERGYRHIFVNIPAKLKAHFIEYDLLPGITLYFNKCDLIQRYTNNDPIIQYTNPKNMTVFNYLIKGQAQIGVDDNKYIPIKEDDIYIHAIPTYETTFSFYGETMLLHIVLDKSEIEKRKDTYSIEYYKLLNKLFSITENEKNIIFKSEHKIKDILMDMRVYDAKDDISQRVYYQIKIIEIITYLYELNISAMDNNYKTYTDAQIRVVRKIKNHLSRDIASYISLEVLANSYGINLTTLKNCFRDMYGKPLYTWYREYKFLRAKELIKNTDYPISKIANMIGYKSSSKFTKAFKKEMGVLPSSYRKNKK